MYKQKVGILGGTFDPPHIGHLIIAKEAVVQCALNKVWFMPSASPPHKEVDGVSAGKDRIEMVKKMIEGEEDFDLTLIEFERNGPSYTVDTIKELNKKHPDTQFHFIIGGDSVEALHTWERIDELADAVTFIGVRRLGYDFSSPYLDKIKVIDTPLIDISSTMLRERFQQNQNTHYYLSDEVRKYIEVNRLYDKR